MANAGIAKTNQILIQRSSLPIAEIDFGLEEDDFNLNNAKVLINGVLSEPVSRKKDELAIGIPTGLDYRLLTIVLVTGTGDPIGVLKYGPSKNDPTKWERRRE